MSSESRDLTIDIALADPMIQAVMRADHVDPRAFEALLRGTADAKRAARPRLSRAPALLMSPKSTCSIPHVCFA